MILEFSLDRNDHLTYQLFEASKSKRIKRTRLFLKLFLPIFFFIYGLVALGREHIIASCVFFSIAVLCFFFYPLWNKKRYENHYGNYLDETYKAKFGEKMTLEITKNDLIYTAESSESKTSTNQMQEIVEIPTMILVKLKVGAYILPKEKITDIEGVKKELKELSEFLQIPYTMENNWKWK